MLLTILQARPVSVILMTVVVVLLAKHFQTAKAEEAVVVLGTTPRDRQVAQGQVLGLMEGLVLVVLLEPVGLEVTSSLVGRMGRGSVEVAAVEVVGLGLKQLETAETVVLSSSTTPTLLLRLWMLTLAALMAELTSLSPATDSPTRLGPRSAGLLQPLSLWSTIPQSHARPLLMLPVRLMWRSLTLSAMAR